MSPEDASTSSNTTRDGTFFASLMGSGSDFVSHATSKQSIFALVAAGYGIALAVESQSMLAWPGVGMWVDPCQRAWRTTKAASRRRSKVRSCKGCWYPHWGVVPDEGDE